MLTDYLAALYRRVGVPTNSARMIAHMQVDTDRLGALSHGRRYGLDSTAVTTAR